jgi:hypothetical protein
MPNDPCLLCPGLRCPTLLCAVLCYAVLLPCCAVVLQALCALNEATFRVELGRFFPVLTRLISCDHTTADVQRSLSDLFLTRVGPLLVASNGAAAAAALPLVAPPLPAVTDGMSVGWAQQQRTQEAAVVGAPAAPAAAAVFGDSLLL